MRNSWFGVTWSWRRVSGIWVSDVAWDSDILLPHALLRNKSKLSVHLCRVQERLLEFWSPLVLLFCNDLVPGCFCSSSWNRTWFHSQSQLSLMNSSGASCRKKVCSPIIPQWSSIYFHLLPAGDWLVDPTRLFPKTPHLLRCRVIYAGLIDLERIGVDEGHESHRKSARNALWNWFIWKLGN